MKKETRLLAAVLILSAVLRSIAIHTRGIWYDDAFSIFLSRQPFSAIIPGTAADTMPPLYYFLLHLWMQFGESVWFLRTLGILINLGTIALLYFLVRRILGSKAGLWAAFLVAISPFQIYNAQELRQYALLAFCQTGYALFFVHLWQSDLKESPWDWLGLILCGAAALYSHNLAVFTLVAPDLFLALRRDWRRLFRLLAAQAVSGLLFLPWLFYLPGQIAKIQQAWWISPPGLVELIQSIIIFTSNLPLPSGIWLAVALLLSMQGMALLAFELAHEDEKRSEMALLIAFAAVPPLLMLAASYLVKPIFAPRGFIFSALAYDGLVGYAIARNWPKAGAVLTAIFVAGALVALPYQYHYNQFPRSPFREAAQYLEEVAQPGDRIIHDNKLSGFPMRYYAPDLPQRFIADIPRSQNDTLALGSQQAMDIFADPDLQTAAGDSRRVYFLVFRETQQDYASLGLAVHPSLQWLRANYRQTSQIAFEDLEIYSFEH